MKKESSTKPYRPSSGFEGLWFESKYCHNCKHDTPSKPCDIILMTMFYDVDEPEYPKEWVTVNSEPTCTAFKEQGNDTHNAKK